jgi:hypothetical protein
MIDNQHDAAWPQENGMSSTREDIAREVADLKREVQELKARLLAESGQRAIADESLSSRIAMLSVATH